MNTMIVIEARSTGGSIAAGRECLTLDIPLFTPEYEGMPEWAVGNRELMAQGARPLHKTRATARASLDTLLGAVRAALALPPGLAPQLSMFGS